MMKTIELTKEEKSLLKVIMNDKFSNGAFSGMIFNAYIQSINNKIEVGVDALIKQALAVRIMAHNMSEDTKSVMTGQSPNDMPSLNKEVQTQPQEYNDDELF